MWDHGGKGMKFERKNVIVQPNKLSYLSIIYFTLNSSITLIYYVGVVWWGHDTTVI